MEASQTFKDRRSRLTKEQRERVTPELVEEIMEKHVLPEHWPSFRRRHKAEFRKIAEGYVSQCMTFTAKDTKRPYKARIKGLLVSEVNGEERISFDFLFAQRKLVIPNRMQIKNGQDAINISDEQIEKLKAGDFLDELLVSEKGAKFFAEVDTELNRLAIAEATYVRAPKTLHGSVLTSEQSNAIMNGKSMEYERENPNDKSQVFVLKARYSPIYYTIRSESVLDKNGKPLVRSVSVSEEPSQTLQSVEEAVKMSAQKTKKRVSQQRQM